MTGILLVLGIACGAIYAGVEAGRAYLDDVGRGGGRE